MRIYWTLRSIPELADLPLRQRTRVWRYASLQSLGQWQTWAVCFLPGTLGGLGITIDVTWGAFPWGWLVGGGIGGFIASQLMVSYVRPYIKEALAEPWSGGKGEPGHTSAPGFEDQPPMWDPDLDL